MGEEYVGGGDEAEGEMRLDVEIKNMEEIKLEDEGGGGDEV